MKDWNNIDLRSHEVDSALIDEYTFNTLLLEIKCNVKEITPETVRAQFNESLKASMHSAREVFESNFKNIVKEVQRQRAQK